MTIHDKTQHGNLGFFESLIAWPILPSATNMSTELLVPLHIKYIQALDTVRSFMPVYA